MARTNRRPPASSLVAELSQLAIDLDLTTLAAELTKLLDQAEQQAWSYTDFGLALFRAELSARNDRRLKRSMKRSRLGSVEGLDGYDFSIRPQLDSRVIQELLNGRYIEEHRNILCLGKPGLGKTRIAKALVHAACLAGYSALCVNTADMLHDIHASLADGTYRRAMRRYIKPSVLLCDEFGYEAFDTQATNHLFRIVSARYRQGSIVLTANTGFSKWKQFFPTETMAVATVDRLVDNATILRFTGTKSFREPKDVYGALLED
jgi:DNA replication protein DnaC